MSKLLLLTGVCSGLAGCVQNNQDAASEQAAEILNPVRILSPKKGAPVPAWGRFDIQYDIRPSSEGAHVHLHVDQNNPQILKNMRGFHTVGGLAPGLHTIRIIEVNNTHHPTGEAAAITVIAR